MYDLHGYALYVQKKVQISFYLCILTIKSLYTWKKRLFSLLCLLGTVAGLFAGDTAYLFSYFINDSRDGLHLAYSLDGLTWDSSESWKIFLDTYGREGSSDA